MTHAPDLSGWTREEIRDTLNEVRFPVEVAVWHTDNYFNFGAIVRNCHNFLVRSIHAIDVSEDSGLMYEKATMVLTSMRTYIVIVLGSFWDILVIVH